MWLWKKTLKMLIFSISISSAVKSSLLPHLKSFRTVLKAEEKYILRNSSQSLNYFLFYKKDKVDTAFGSAHRYVI